MNFARETHKSLKGTRKKSPPIDAIGKAKQGAGLTRVGRREGRLWRGCFVIQLRDQRFWGQLKEGVQFFFSSYFSFTYFMLFSFTRFKSRVFHTLLKSPYFPFPIKYRKQICLLFCSRVINSFLGNIYQNNILFILLFLKTNYLYIPNF